MRGKSINWSNTSRINNMWHQTKAKYDTFLQVLFATVLLNNLSSFKIPWHYSGVIVIAQSIFLCWYSCSTKCCCIQHSLILQQRYIFSPGQLSVPSLFHSLPMAKGIYAIACVCVIYLLACMKHYISRYKGCLNFKLGL